MTAYKDSKFIFGPTLTNPPLKEASWLLGALAFPYRPLITAKCRKVRSLLAVAGKGRTEGASDVGIALARQRGLGRVAYTYCGGGNGRHAGLMADVLAKLQSRPEFT